MWVKKRFSEEKAGWFYTKIVAPSAAQTITRENAALVMNKDLAVASASAIASSASDTLSLLAKSKLGLSGLALAFSGFFGIFGVLGLQLQSAIIAAYVFLFGVALILFSLGAHSEKLLLYFGFMYQPNGQLYFLLVAGNLAWSCGFLGFLAALFTNSVAIGAWYTANGTTVEALPAWLTGQPSHSQQGSATGMVDIDRDELL